MDWNSLLSAIVGGLLTVIPVLITIRNQSKERDKDRQEQRSEATIQLALELIRSDIKIAQDSINNALKLMDIVEEFRIRKNLGQITEDEMWKELNALLSDDSKHSALADVDTVAETLAFSLGIEFYREYKNFDSEYTAFLNYATKSPTFSLDDEGGLRLAVIRRAAKLHIMLRDIPISIRNTVK